MKKLKFFHLLCVSKIDREKLFAEVLEKTHVFKDYKNRCLRKPQIRIFPNGLVHGFGQKFEISSTLNFMQNTPRKGIWERSSEKQVSIILCNPL